MMNNLKKIACIALISLSTSVIANPFSGDPETGPVDDLIPALIKVIESPNSFSEPRQLVARYAERLLIMASATGPIYVTASRLAPLDDGCYMIGVQYEVRGALTRDGGRVTAMVNSPTPVCPDGRIPKKRLTPDQLAGALQLMDETKRAINDSIYQK